MSARLLSTAGLVMAALLLTACGAPTPVPTPSPTPNWSAAADPSATSTPSASSTPQPAPDPVVDPTPPVADLVLSPTGLGPLLLGSPAAASPMLAVEMQSCAEGADPFESWTAAYPMSPDLHGNPAPPFVVGTIRDDTVPVVTVLDPQIRTTGGTRLGDTLEQFLAAHPDAVEGESREPWRRFLITGTPGTVIVDVAVASDPGYWGEFQGRVVGLSAVIPAGPIGATGFHGVNPSPCT